MTKAVQFGPLRSRRVQPRRISGRAAAVSTSTAPHVGCSRARRPRARGFDRCRERHSELQLGCAIANEFRTRQNRCMSIGSREAQDGIERLRAAHVAAAKTDAHCTIAKSQPRLRPAPDCKEACSRRGACSSADDADEFQRFGVNVLERARTQHDRHVATSSH